MRRSLRPDEMRLWRRIAATVRAAPGRELPADAPGPVVAEASPLTVQPAAPARPPKPARKPSQSLHAIEPNRERRIAVGRDPIGATLDLHGMTQDVARASLAAFLIRAQAEGHRAVLVITGRGYTGDGVLRRRTPEWLAHAPLRSLVAGVSPARRRHGGEGALYVALKRPSPHG